MVAYAVAASMAAARGGRRRLWLTGAAALVLIAAAALGLCRYFGVPSYARLLLYMMAFTAPVVVVPTVLLSFSSGPRPTWTGRLPMAVLGRRLRLRLAPDRRGTRRMVIARVDADPKGD